MKKSYFGRLQQWIHAGYRMPAQKIIERPENHWKFVTSLTLIRSNSIVPRSWTSTNSNDASATSGPLWVAWLLNVMSTRLRSCWRRTFWAHTAIKMMSCDTWDVFQRHSLPVTLLFVAIQLIIQIYTYLLRWRLYLTLQISQGSASTYFRWSGQFRHSFIKGFFRDNPSNFY